MEEFKRLEMIYTSISILWKILRNTNTLSFVSISQGNFEKLTKSLKGGMVAPEMKGISTEMDDDELVICTEKKETKFPGSM